jgi:histidinol dehydrogenase
MEKLVNISIESALDKCVRPVYSTDKITPIVDEIFKEVKLKGDIAIKRYTHFFDKVDLENIQVNNDEINDAVGLVNEELKSAIQLAKSNIEKFHKSQLGGRGIVETMPGVTCWQENRPIEKVGIYIPAGSAPLFSTVLMLGVPAVLAGCKEIVLCTPPDINGNVNPVILYVADLVGIKTIIKAGGVQAIAGLTFGTESIPAVYKIFGPGNQYVTAAKLKSQQFGLAIDMPAGPSELLVVADESSDPAFIASDLLSQAEHGSDSQVICLVNNLGTAESIEKEIEAQLILLPREEIARKALDNSKVVVYPTDEYCLQFINEYAAEHLILVNRNPEDLIPKIMNAGSVFIGKNAAESVGDYASGTNHTLPTNGYSKTYSGVNMDAFTKKITFQEITDEGLLNIGPAIEKMAEAEGLQGHKNAVTLRLKKIKIEA